MSNMISTTLAGYLCKCNKFTALCQTRINTVGGSILLKVCWTHLPSGKLTTWPILHCAHVDERPANEKKEHIRHFNHQVVAEKNKTGHSIRNYVPHCVHVHVRLANDKKEHLRHFNH